MKQRANLSFRKLFWQLATFVALVILFASPLSAVLQKLGGEHEVPVPTVVSTVDAHAIYPMFTCPCCGEPLDEDDPCCVTMTQMIDYIDQRVDTGASKDAVILATAREFGLERLTNESDRRALRETLRAQAPDDAPRIVLSETKKDLGIVSQKDGTVTTEFTIRNDGGSDLVIDKLSSSCGCTSGRLVYRGVEGPRFYMAGHDYPEPDPGWQAAIAPGDEATIAVYYDPTVHPELTGPVTRTLSIHSNDPVDFETTVMITLEQTE